MGNEEQRQLAGKALVHYGPNIGNDLVAFFKAIDLDYMRAQEIAKARGGDVDEIYHQIGVDKEAAHQRRIQESHEKGLKESEIREKRRREFEASPEGQAEKKRKRQEELDQERKRKADLQAQEIEDQFAVSEPNQKLQTLWNSCLKASGGNRERAVKMYHERVGWYT